MCHHMLTYPLLAKIKYAQTCGWLCNSSSSEGIVSPSEWMLAWQIARLRNNQWLFFLVIANPRNIRNVDFQRDPQDIRNFSSQSQSRGGRPCRRLPSPPLPLHPAIVRSPWTSGPTWQRFSWEMNQEMLQTSVLPGEKLDDGWPESEKDVFQAALRMVVVKDSR